MPTLCAIQYNAPLKAFYQRLTDNGKPGKLAVTAAMRSLYAFSIACSPTPISNPHEL
jgi:hypothetical protein